MSTAPAATASDARSGQIRLLPTSSLNPCPFSLSVYGDPVAETDGLLEQACKARTASSARPAGRLKVFMLLPVVRPYAIQKIVT